MQLGGDKEDKNRSKAKSLNQEELKSFVPQLRDESRRTYVGTIVWLCLCRGIHMADVARVSHCRHHCRRLYRQSPPHHHYQIP